MPQSADRFKEGDKVKVVANTQKHLPGNYLGKHGRVVHTTGKSSVVKIVGDPRDIWFSDEELEKMK